jgi:hypothetical protein
MSHFSAFRGSNRRHLTPVGSDIRMGGEIELTVMAIPTAPRLSIQWPSFLDGSPVSSRFGCDSAGNELYLRYITGYRNEIADDHIWISNLAQCKRFSPLRGLNITNENPLRIPLGRKQGLWIISIRMRAVSAAWARMQWLAAGVTSLHQRARSARSDIPSRCQLLYRVTGSSPPTAVCQAREDIENRG